MDSVVFTIIGDDRPGVVEQIATTVNQHDANWLGSRMSQLGGKFAGMIQASGAQDQLSTLTTALEALEGLTIVVQPAGELSRVASRRIVVTMLGLDRPGIVREVSMTLRAAGLNVLELTTDVSQAAMTGGLMFHGRAIVDAANGDLVALAQRLDDASQALGVDIEIADED